MGRLLWGAEMRVNYKVIKICENCGGSTEGRRLSCSGCGFLFDTEVL